MLRVFINEDRQTDKYVLWNNDVGMTKTMGNLR